MPLQPKPGHVVAVAAIPPCDLCQNGTPAVADVATSMGPWANVCENHWQIYGVAPGQTGVGLGQRLTLREAG